METKETEKSKETKCSTQDLSIEDFIQKFLIDEIKEIKDKHPYMAFILMSSGIEFLGRYMRNFITKYGVGEQCFNWAVQELPSLKKCLKEVGLNVAKDDLYEDFRCGLIHQFRLKTSKILLADKNATTDKTIDCDKFYNAFKEACKEAMKFVAEEHRKSESFITITNRIVGDKTISETGTTSYTEIRTDSNKKDDNTTK